MLYLSLTRTLFHWKVSFQFPSQSITFPCCLLSFLTLLCFLVVFSYASLLSFIFSYISLLCFIFSYISFLFLSYVFIFYLFLPKTIAPSLGKVLPFPVSCATTMMKIAMEKNLITRMKANKMREKILSIFRF